MTRFTCRRVGPAGEEQRDGRDPVARGSVVQWRPPGHVRSRDARAVRQQERERARSVAGRVAAAAGSDRVEEGRPAAAVACLGCGGWRG